MAIIPVPAKFSFGKLPSFKLQRSSNILRSKYTGQAQVVVFPYAVWMLQGNLTEYDGLNAGSIRSFLVQLEGQKNTFRLPVPGFTRPMNGFDIDASAFNAAAARASSITMVSTPVRVSVPFLNEGDYFTVNDELKIVTSSVALNAGGIATIPFQPPLRKPVLANAAIKLQNPTILMRAADDDVANWAVLPPIRQQANFNAIEAVEI